jgi:hypothetical protein
MPPTLRYLIAMAAFTPFATSAGAQSARDIRGPSPLVAIENEPPPRANVRDGTMGLDGAGFVLDVLQMGSDGFAGRWGPAGIIGTEEGYFCASRSVQRR